MSSSEPAAVEALQAGLEGLYGETPGAPSPDAMSDLGGSNLDLFISGRTAMTSAGRWGAFFFQNMEDAWEVVPAPTM